MAKTNRPSVWAHRGASRVEPENTLAAFRRARLLGADGVELDVRRLADGTVAVHHDARLADGRLLSQCGRGDLPPMVPSLAEALAASAALVVNVEVKHDGGPPDEALVEATLAAIAEWRGSAILSSFDRATTDLAHRLAPALPVGLLYIGSRAELDPSRLLGALAEVGYSAIHPFDALVDAELVGAAHQLGLEVNVWTVDDPRRVQNLAAFGVDAIITNLPDVAGAALRGPRE